MFRLFKKDTVPSEVSLTVSNRTVLRVVLLILLALMGVSAIRHTSHELLLIFTAFFLALALNAPVHWVAQHLPGKKRGSRALATSIAFLLVIALLGGFFASIVPPLVKQTQHFITAAPGIVRDLRSQNSEIGKLVRHYHLENQVDTFSNQLSDRLKGVSGSVVSTVTKVGSSIFSMLTILVLTFMMLVEGPHWLEFIRELAPKAKRKHLDELGLDMYRVVKGYVNGQVTLAAIAAVLIVPALFILHISYPVALMVIIFICGLIPLVGHTIGAIIVTFVALAHSPVSAIIILAYYIFYQQVENYLIQPRIQANSTNLSPLFVFTSVIIGVGFNGLFGGLVAIPIMGCLRVLTLDYLKAHEVLAGKPAIEEEVTEATGDTK